MPEIRRLTEEEEQEADLVWLRGFQHASINQVESMHRYRDTFPNRIERFGLWDSAGLQATFEMCNEHLYFGPDAIVPNGYISTIACLPAARGRGYARAGLKYMLSHMRDSGQLLSTLLPFSFGYYRQFGWDWISPCRYYKIPSDLLQPDPETEQVRAATNAADRDKIKAAYKQFSGGYRGMVVRDDIMWDRILDDTKEHFTYSYIYERDGLVEGYLVYRGGDTKETWLREFIALTPRSQRAILGLLRRHEMQVQRFAWKAPEDDGLWSQSYEMGLETAIGTNDQGRVVDFAAAVSAWKPQASARGTVVLCIRDECAPWNDGIWKVTFEEGNVSVRSTREEAQVSLDIQAFSQAFFGVLTVAVLRKWERLVVHQEAGYHALCDLLAGPPSWSLG